MSVIEELLGDMGGEELEVSEASSTDCKYLSENLVELKKIKPGSISINTEKFQDGVDSMSKLCGQISALINIGINPNKAMDYIVDKEASMDMMMHNIKITEISSQAAVNAARFEGAAAKATSI